MHRWLVLYELDDITRTWLTSRVSQYSVVTVKLLHRSEVCITHTNDNHWACHVWKAVDKVSCLVHIMDSAIGQEQEDRVSATLLHRLHILNKFIEEGSKQSGSCQAYLRKSLLVCGDYVLNSNDIWVVSSSIDRKAVGDALNADVPRNTTKSENGETAIGVVWFHDLAHVKKGGFVLIWALTDVMKGALWRWFTVASRVIDGGHQTNLPTRSQIVNEGGSSKDFDVIENQHGTTFATQPLLVILKLVETGDECVKYAVLGTYQGKLYSLIQVAITELCQW